MRLALRTAAAWLLLAAALLALALVTPAAAQDAPPDWRGVWFLETAIPDINGFPPPDERTTSIGDTYPLLGFQTAPLNAEGQRRLAAMLAGQGDDKAAGWGYPMMMSGAAPLQFLVTPGETLILNAYRDIRHVYTDGRPLPPEEDRWHTVWGESVGRWDGDTLVIETVSVEDPLGYFFIGPPVSRNARYTERIRLVAPGRIENRMTIEDPETLSAPWTATMVYVRAEGLDRLIHDSFTNDRSAVENGVFTIEPPAKER